MRKQLEVYMKSKMMFFHGKEEYDENLFLSRTGRRLTVEMIERIYREVGEISKITRGIGVSPHTSRRTFAVKMLETNDIYTVSKLLGHFNVSITETYLQFLTNEKLIYRS